MSDDVDCGADAQAITGGAKLRGSHPLAALADLGNLAGPPKAVTPVLLPDLQACMLPLDTDALNAPDGMRYWRERCAGQAELHDELARLMELESALTAAREGRLDADWREQGLAKAVAMVEAGQRNHNLWAWLKIVSGSRDLWEPNAVAYAAESGLPVTWKTALHRWRGLLLGVKAAREALDPQAASRWAGFNLVNAWMFNKSVWDSVLDRHEGPWPPSLLDDDGRWSASMHAHRLLQELDGIQLSFEMGLAAGGESIDWRGRHALRLEQWRMTTERDRELARLARASTDSYVYRIPAAWLAAA